MPEQLSPEDQAAVDALLAKPLTVRREHTSYSVLADTITRFAAGLVGLGLRRGERIAVYLEKRVENVAAIFGASAAGCAFARRTPLRRRALNDAAHGAATRRAAVARSTVDL